MKNINIAYFALLREQRGCAQENISTSAATALDLYNELQQRYNFTLGNKSLQVAINDEFTGWDTQLENNDKIVFIPPVAGG